MYRFLISGGGTGGHIFPAIAIADELKQKYPTATFLFVGASDRMEMQKVPDVGYDIEGLWISGFQRDNMFKNLLLPLKLLVSLLKSFFILKKHKPSLVIGTGGYASAALLKVAGFLKIPYIIQEQNSLPGITNKLLANNAQKICVAYEGLEKYFPKDKLIYTGNPVRKNILLQSSDISPDEFFNLKKDKKTLLILGGSLGAKQINSFIATKISYFKEQDIQVLWQCGQLYYDTYKVLNSDIVRVEAFISRMDLAYDLADVILSRSGANSVSELSIVAKPVLFVPSPNVAEDHQTKNAIAIVEKGGAQMINEKDLKLYFEEYISSLFFNDTLREELSRNFKLLAKPNATKDIITEIDKLITKT